jgi:hypothetical protein
MTVPEDPAPVVLPAAEAAHLRDLLSQLESWVTWLHHHGETRVLASLEEYLAPPGRGLEARQLLAGAHLGLTELMTAARRQ